MTNDRMDEARAGLPEWSAEFEQYFIQLAEVLEAPVERCRQDPALLVPYAEAFVSGLPLDELDQEDRVVLRTRMVAYVARLLIAHHGARWDVQEDETRPAGFRYVLRPPNPRPGRSWVDPFAVVMNEFHNRPVEITRMLATAELAIGVAEPGPGIPG